MRPIPDWKWRRDNRVTLRRLVSKRAHQITRYASPLEKSVIKEIMPNIADYLVKHYHKNNLDFNQVKEILANIYDFDLDHVNPIEASYLGLLYLDPYHVEVWNNYMFELKLVEKLN